MTIKSENMNLHIVNRNRKRCPMVLSIQLCFLAFWNKTSTVQCPNRKWLNCWRSAQFLSMMIWWLVSLQIWNILQTIQWVWDWRKDKWYWRRRWNSWIRINNGRCHAKGSCRKKGWDGGHPRDTPRNKAETARMCSWELFLPWILQWLGNKGLLHSKLHEGKR